MKKEKNNILLNLKMLFHFFSTVLMYSICLIMIIVFFVFVINFIDQQRNLKLGNNKKTLFSAYTIVSPSMVPAINVLDVVVTMRVNSPAEIKKGDIVTFNSTDYRYSGVVITHRILSVEKTSDGKYLYTTKGDNNNTKDSSRITFDDIYGRVLFRIPKIGYIQYYLSSVLGWVVMIIVPAVLIIGYDIFKLIKTLRNGRDVDKNERKNIRNREGRYNK